MCDSNSKKASQSIVFSSFVPRHAAYFERFDLIGIGTKLLHGNSVSYINDLIDTTYFSRKPDNAFLFGYPTGLIKTDGKVIFSFTQEMLAGKYSDNFTFDFSPRFITARIKTVMSESEILDKLRKTEFTINNIGKPGESGSPVFGKFKQGDKWVYRFIGMIWGCGNNDFPYSMAYSGQTIYQNLTRKP